MKVISLTSIPSRFAHIQPTLECLAAQGADVVRLYIPLAYRRFPDWNGQLPAVPAGVTIVRCEADLGPATKILPACRDLRTVDAQILFCDDDCTVPDGWARKLFALQARRPQEAVAVYVRPAQGYVPNVVRSSKHRAWQLPIRYDLLYRASRLAQQWFGTQTLARRPFVIPGYGDIFFGAGGVVVKPTFFDDVAYDIPDVAWPVDDVWLSANLARRSILIRCAWLMQLPRSEKSSEIDALLDASFLSMKRQELNRAAALHCQSVFGIWA